MTPSRAPVDARHGTRLAAFAAAIVVFVVALLPTVWAIGSSPLARTEPHRAIPAHAMVTTGDWLVPRLYGVAYLRKPPLHYWLLAATEWITGSKAEWVYRLPSALAGALTCVAACLAAQRWFGRGDRRTAIVTGLAGGLACFALVPLWGQWRSADVDATSTLFTIVAALAIIEVGRRSGRRAGVAAAIAAVAFGAAALVKGPACLPTVVGAVAAAAWLGRRGRVRTIAWSLAALVVGSGLFAIWGAAALRAIGGAGAFDWSGVQEALDRADGDTGGWAARLAVPLLTFAYGVPITLVAFLARRGELRAALGTRAFRVATALLLAWIVASVIGIFGGIDNPRYAYGSLPLFAPLAGAVAAVAARGGWPEATRLVLRAALTAVTFAIGAVSIVMWLRLDDHGPMARWIGIVVAASVAATTIAFWMKRRARPALVGTVASLMLMGVAFGDQRNASRRGIASVAAAAQLRGVIGDRPRVVAGMWVMNGPELFHYAGVDVTYHPDHIVPATPLVAGDWVVFQRPEWDALTPEFRAGFTDVTELAVRSNNAVLAKFAGPQTPDS